MNDKAINALQDAHRRAMQRLQQHMEIILTLHQSYRIKKTIIPDMPEQEHIITITKLGIYEINFTITGPGVVEPERPRTMPTGVFATWMQLINATPITHEDTAP